MNEPPSLLETVKTIPEILTAVNRIRSRSDGESLIFRGETSTKRKLVPKSARTEYNTPDWETTFKSWKAKVREIKKLPGNEWRRLALAQHHGLATPLLDWSSNVLVAAYFSVGDGTGEKRDGLIYCFQPAIRWNPADHKGGLQDLRLVLKLGRTRKPYGVLAIDRLSPREGAQEALFTVHYDDCKCMRKEKWPFTHKMVDEPDRTENLSILKIPRTSKDALRGELLALGFSPSRLFPDLDGVSEEVNRSLRSQASRS